MKNILIVAESPSSVCNYYRNAGPVLDLGSEVNVRCATPENLSWLDFTDVDIAAFARPDTQLHYQLMLAARFHGCKVWVDIDDNLFAIPPENPAFLRFHKPDTRKAIVECIKAADIYTVSTEALGTQLAEIRADFQVVPNFPRNFHKPGLSQPAVAKPTRVVWRGSSTHINDVLAYAPQTTKVLAEQATHLGMFGWLAFPIVANGYQIEHAPEKPILEYLQMLAGFAPQVQIVPLIDSLFNRAKSNIAWIEASLAGAVTVAPNWPEWQQPGVYLYDSQKSYEKQLKRAITNEDGKRDENLALSVAAVEELRVSAKNKLRAVLGIEVAK